MLLETTTELKGKQADEISIIIPVYNAEEILENSTLREQIVRNARKLAEKNHNAEVNPKKVREWLELIIKQADPK